MSLRGRTLVPHQKSVLLVFVPAFPKRTYSLFTRLVKVVQLILKSITVHWVTVHWEKGHKILQGLLDSGFELINSRRPKIFLWFSGQSSDLWKAGDQRHFSSSSSHSVQCES